MGGRRLPACLRGPKRARLRAQLIRPVERASETRERTRSVHRNRSHERAHASWSSLKFSLRRREARLAKSGAGGHSSFSNATLQGRLSHSGGRGLLKLGAWSLELLKPRSRRAAACAPRRIVGGQPPPSDSTSLPPRRRRAPCGRAAATARKEPRSRGPTLARHGAHHLAPLLQPVWRERGARPSPTAGGRGPPAPAFFFPRCAHASTSLACVG